MNFFKKIIIILKKRGLARKLSKLFRDDLTTVLINEEFNLNYMNQSDFDTCLARAEAMIGDAIIRTEETLAYSTAYHRVNCHGDIKHRPEENKLSKSLGAKEKRIARRVWWVG